MIVEDFRALHRIAALYVWTRFVSFPHHKMVLPPVAWCLNLVSRNSCHLTSVTLTDRCWLGGRAQTGSVMFRRKNRDPRNENFWIKVVNFRPDPTISWLRTLSISRRYEIQCCTMATLVTSIVVKVVDAVRGLTCDYFVLYTKLALLELWCPQNIWVAYCME